MLIQVDVDSTLYDADSLFAKIANDNGVKWRKNSTHWFGATDIGTDVKTLKNIFRISHSQDVVLRNKPYPNSVEVLAGLVRDYDDVEIAYVSDRNIQQEKALRLWLEDQGFLTEEGQKVVATKDKRHWMREHRPEIVIDDRVRTLLMARYELNARGVTLQHSWNINLKNEADGIFICRDWPEIDQVVRDIIDSYSPVSHSKEF